MPDVEQAKREQSNKYFVSTTEFKASERGTGNTYKIFQQDIDPDMYIPTLGKTNRELMLQGKAPYLVKDGKQVRVELHHSRQNAEGPLFEVSSTSHKAKTGQGGEALHPYKTKLGRKLNGDGSGEKLSAHPDKPVVRKEFDKDREEIYKERIKKIDEGGDE